MTSSSKKQIPTEYKSGLPDFLLSFVDSIIKTDTSQIMRYNFLHYSVDELLREDLPREDSLWIFIDPIGDKHILVENIASHGINFPFRKAQTFTRSQWAGQTAQQFASLSYKPHPLLSKILSSSQLQKLSSQNIVTIDQIRLNCLANIYFQPEELISDIKAVLSWNQVFRAKSANSFLYVSQLFERIVQIINKKKFHKKFASVKTKDFQRLLNFQLAFKANVKNWPYIPDKFRQYEEIDHYQPSPKDRQQYIKERVKSKKVPVECPNECVCFSTDQVNPKQFCQYTLKDGWLSECPNRANKIQCSHEDPKKMQLCKNAEIKKNLRRKCKKEDNDNSPKNQIQECIIWGIDLFTRTLIYHSLPQVDIQFPQCLDNKNQKSLFIEESFLKAINFNGREGYKMEKACMLIMGKELSESLQLQNITKLNVENEKNQQSPPKRQENEKRNWRSSYFMKRNIDFGAQNIPVQSGINVFSSQDKFYAQILLKNYRYCMEKIDKTAYRIHTKGKGARCINKDGIKQGRFIVEYFGELYQSWRWYEREDFIKKMINNKKMKNFIPEFYNIYLETHVDDPEGYDLMVVDPIKKGNFSSRFSHSCNPNCGTVTTISNGKYYIGMYSFKDIKFGQELTFDYCCVTESKNEHQNSICLCGMEKCRGYYLQLANSKIYNTLIDKHNCFHSRNSFVLKSSENQSAEELQKDIDLCAKHNIKERMIDDVPKWIVKWIACLLRYMEEECEIYKEQMVQRLQSTDYHFHNFCLPPSLVTIKKETEVKSEQPTPEKQKMEDQPKVEEKVEFQPKVAEEKPQNSQRQQKIQLISETSKQELLSLRIQNLFTTVNKLKYFLNSIHDETPPLYYLSEKQIQRYMISDSNSVLQDLQEVLVQDQHVQQAELIKKFLKMISSVQEIKHKLFLFRLCCLCIGHMCLYLKTTPRFNSHLVGDIAYFYAFTHTYFTSHQYKSYVSEEIKVALQEVTGNPLDKSSEKEKKRYSSQFVWGQLAFWYKQTIVNPEASLSQDRRGTLSYPLIKTSTNSVYPYEKHCRKNFLKALRQKPASSWPSAAQDGCILSFKNPFKCYGTVFFQSVHSKKILQKNLPQEYSQLSLVDNILNVINSPFIQKLNLFKNVENVLSGINQFHEGYQIINFISGRYINFQSPLPINMLDQCGAGGTGGNKKKKVNPVSPPEEAVEQRNKSERRSRRNYDLQDRIVTNIGKSASKPDIEANKSRQGYGALGKFQQHS